MFLESLYTPKIKELLAGLSSVEKSFFDLSMIQVDDARRDPENKISWIKAFETVSLNCIVQAAKISGECSQAQEKFLNDRILQLSKKEAEIFNRAFWSMNVARESNLGLEGIRRILLVMALVYDQVNIHLLQN